MLYRRKEVGPSMSIFALASAHQFFSSEPAIYVAAPCCASRVFAGSAVYEVARNWTSQAMDRLKPIQRSNLMARVRTQNTAPEMRVRRIVFSLGFRYRLHVPGLPGKPDLVFVSRRKIIFVHGCFWHQHSCKRGVGPASNKDFWDKKLTRNRKRDRANVRNLRRSGWDVMVVWECQTNDSKKLALKLHRFLTKDGIG